MGMQQVSVIEAPYEDVLSKDYFDSENISNNITFVTNPTKTKLFKGIPQHLVNVIQKENITYNFHHDGVLPEVFRKYPGLQDYTVIAHAYDLKGVEYVAAIEHKKYPIYAIQFHPEKNLHTWKYNSNVPHSLNAIELAQYFGNFFVNEARKNFNSFKNSASETQARIENYKFFFDDANNIRNYLFKE